jgi:PAS domain S-box-containing protein
MSVDREDDLLRDTALKNIEAILSVRERQSRELVEAKNALEKRTEELQQQREWLEVTLASLGDAVITTDMGGFISFMNPMAERMCGWAAEDAQGALLGDVFNVVNEDTREPATNPILRALKTGRREESMENAALIARDGMETSIELSAAPIRNGKLAISGAVMVFHDVGRRRRAERALLASEQRLSAVFSQAALGINVTDLEGRLLEANTKFCSILGYTIDEIRDWTMLDLTHPDDRRKTALCARRLVLGEIENYAIDKRYRRKNGSMVWCHVTVTTLRTEDGTVTRLVGIIQDITAQKVAEELQSRLAAVVEYSMDAIITKTLEGVIATWNPGAEKIFGFEAREAIGQPITLLIPEGRLQEEAEILEKVSRGEMVETYETVRLRKDGSLIDVSVTVSPIKDAEGLIIGASKIARDITRQKRAEEALRQMDQRKDIFLATLAHELRNPLAPIRQAAMISNAASATTEQMRWSHEVISRQVHHMSLLLDDLLDISRITRGNLELRREMTELSAIIEAACEIARPAIQAKGHHFTVDIPALPIRFSADPLRLAQVISNLLTNAAKYTDSGGEIRLSAEATRECVSVVVRDNGIGLTRDVQAAIFSIFSQVKSSLDRSEGGLGIGLALSKGVVELHGGTLEVKSDGEGRGSEFTVLIPRVEIAVPADPAEISLPRAGVRRSVLIADDNRDAAESLAILLQMEGHDVSVASNGRQALERIDSLQPHVALIDIGMPELNGYEVAQRVRLSAHGQTMTLIAVTGWGQEADRALAKAAGFNLHFTKPIEPKRIFDLLRSQPPLA